MNDNATWTLANGEDRQHDHPETFDIPTRTERESLSEGDEAKLVFERPNSKDDEPSAERLWVEVIRVEDGFYVGTLDDDPEYLESLHAGSQIIFGPEHVVSINKYWKLLEQKVIVSLTSHEQGIRPRVLFREQPVSESDSGWRALLGNETTEDMKDEDQWLPQQVGYLMRRWPDMYSVFETDPVNGEWEWNDASSSYIRQHNEAATQNPTV